MKKSEQLLQELDRHDKYVSKLKSKYRKESDRISNAILKAREDEFKAALDGLDIVIGAVYFKEENLATNMWVPTKKYEHKYECVHITMREDGALELSKNYLDREWFVNAKKYDKNAKFLRALFMMKVEAIMDDGIWKGREHG
jgi:hypothetical protein